MKNLILLTVFFTTQLLAQAPIITFKDGVKEITEEKTRWLVSLDKHAARYKLNVSNPRHKAILKELQRCQKEKCEVMIENDPFTMEILNLK